MIYPMIPFPVTLSVPLPRFQGHGVIIDVLGVLCVQLMRDLFAIAKFLFACSGILISCHVTTLYNVCIYYDLLFTY